MLLVLWFLAIAAGSFAQVQDLNNAESGLSIRNKLNANFDYLDAKATASGTDTYTASIIPAITSYITGQRFFITFTNANTGAATLNLNALGAKAIKKSGTTALSSGDIAAGQTLCLVYDGTNMQVVGGGSASGGGLSGLSSGFLTSATGSSSIGNSGIKYSTDATTLRPSTNLFNIPGINAGSTPFQMYNHGMIAGQDTTTFPNNKLIFVPKGFVAINWSMGFYNNWRWDEADQRSEPYTTTLPMVGHEIGREGVLTHWTKAGNIPANSFHEINRFGGGIEGFSTISPYTTTVPFNQFKTTIFAKYASTTTPPGSTAESWWGGSGNTFQSRLNPMLWLHSEEVVGTAGTFNVNEYARFEMNASNSGAYPAIYLYKSQGTFASKTAQGTNTITGKIGANIYDGSTFQNTANISFTSGGTVASGDAGGQIVFQTSNTNTTSIANRFRFSQTGSFDVWNGSAWDSGTVGQLLFSTATGVSRWGPDKTITAGGTTGAQTINKIAGTVNFAPGATSLVVTNSLVTSTSHVICTVRTNDGTALLKNVVPASGSFTITLNAAATSETSVGFFVIN